jgi:hypothetical protein
MSPSMVVPPLRSDKGSSLEFSWITRWFAGRLKLISSAPGDELAVVMAHRSVPSPLSLALVTTIESRALLSRDSNLVRRVR